MQQFLQIKYSARFIVQQIQGLCNYILHLHVIIPGRLCLILCGGN